MNSILICRWIVVLVVQALLAGCSTLAIPSEVPDAMNEEDFWRTTYCVAGRLPMEVRFSLADNPERLEGDRFDLSAVDRISEQVDIKVAALLKDSVTAAWQETYGAQASQWSSELTKELADALVVEIVARAPKSLEIDFCGNRESVGGAAYAAIFGYFSRAVQLEDGRWPGWLADAQARSNGGIIVMLAVALRLAQIEFDTGKLVQTLAE